MSWNGTVRCSYCYQSKHNRATCPALLENMKQRLADNPEDLRAKFFFERKAKKQGRLKSCGYCHNAGHTRRTCKELNNAKKVAVEKCCEWRQRFIAEIKKTGLGIGALVQIDSGRPYLGVLTAINWHNLDHRIEFSSSGHDGNKALILHPVGDILESGTRRISSIPNFEGLVSEAQLTYGYGPQPANIIGPISKSAIEKQIPSDFLDGTDCIESIFQESAKSQDRPSSWQVEEWCELVGFYDN